MLTAHNDTLLTNEKTMHALLELIPDSLLHIDSNGVLLGYKFANNMAYVPSYAVVGQNMFESLPTSIVQKLQIAVQQAKKTQKVQTYEYQILIGETSYARRARIIMSGENEFLWLICDITDNKKTEQTLSESENRLRMVISNMPTVLFALDRNGIFLLSDGRGLNVLGLEPGQVVGLSVFDVYKDDPHLLTPVYRALAGQVVTSVNDMGVAIFETQLTPLFDEAGQPNGLIGLSIDITARVKAEKALQERERRFRALSENASDLVLILDATGVCRYASPSHKRVLGYEPESLIGVSVLDLVPHEDFNEVVATLAKPQKDNELTRQLIRIRHANGLFVSLEYVGLNRLNDDAIQGFVINARDVTEQLAMQEILKHQASHDALTNLPNRTLLLERLEQVIKAIEQDEAKGNVALLTMDIDRFKEINDTFGHHHGDLLLQEVSTRLLNATDESATVARLGGDEFALLIPVRSVDCVQHVISKLATVFEKPYIIVEQPLLVQASIGVALYPTHGTDALTLLRRADVAMYNAKEAHQGHMLYDPAYDTYSPRRIALIGALRDAITHNELKLYYQPKVELQTGKVHSVEALVRWQHPEFGFVPPDQFIPLAEQTGLIAPLTLWVLETAICQCSAWFQAGLKLSIAVNLSMWDLRDATLPNTIHALLERYDVSPQLLHVELTESVVMKDVERSLDTLNRLAQLGIEIAIDDFGTGYSSLAYLKRMPISELKIDRSFVMHMAEVEVDATIVQSTVSMAHSLGIKVVAEGVEDEKTWHLLANFHCDTAQGYFMSRPVVPQELEKWLREAHMTQKV
jgi:diguanylate cyclase (GGDEF)-like protein/PAS domain S-box-containing protein